MSVLKNVDPTLIKQLLNIDLDFEILASQLDLFTSKENKALISLLSDVVDYADCVSLSR